VSCDFGVELRSSVSRFLLAFVLLDLQLCQKRQVTEGIPDMVSYGEYRDEELLEQEGMGGRAIGEANSRVGE
jgi:hypothetical protein